MKKKVANQSVVTLCFVVTGSGTEIASVLLCLQNQLIQKVHSKENGGRLFFPKSKKAMGTRTTDTIHEALAIMPTYYRAGITVLLHESGTKSELSS